MKYFYLRIFCLISGICLAQQNDTIRYASFTDNIKTPFNPIGTENTYALKARVLPFLLGNGSGVSTLLGTEIGFLKRNSFGFEGIYITKHDTKDKVTDLQGVYHETGNRSKYFEKAVLVDYRFYFNLQKYRRQNGNIFYTSCFFKKGTIDERNDSNFKNEYVNRLEDYTSYGIVLGSILNFKNSEHFGFDLNLGYFQKDKKIATDYQEATIVSTKNTNEKGTGLRIGLTVDYWFFVKKKKHI